MRRWDLAWNYNSLPSVNLLFDAVKNFCETKIFLCPQQAIETRYEIPASLTLRVFARWFAPFGKPHLRKLRLRYRSAQDDGLGVYVVEDRLEFDFKNQRGITLV